MNPQKIRDRALEKAKDPAILKQRSAHMADTMESRRQVSVEAARTAIVESEGVIDPDFAAVVSVSDDAKSVVVFRYNLYLCGHAIGFNQTYLMNKSGFKLPLLMEYKRHTAAAALSWLLEDKRIKIVSAFKNPNTDCRCLQQFVSHIEDKVKDARSSLAKIEQRIVGLETVGHSLVGVD